jgi:hypothetical protein
VKLYRLFHHWQQSQLTADEPWRRTTAAPYARFRHQFYAFDTFEGIPENGEGERTFAKGNFACSLEEFTRLNGEEGIVEGETVRYFAGTFKEIAERQAQALLALQSAAIINLDCDLYASAIDALAIVAPKLVQGSVLLVDDWNTFAAHGGKGERRAIREFLASHPTISFEPWFAYEFAGQTFLVHTQG